MSSGFTTNSGLRLAVLGAFGLAVAGGAQAQKNSQDFPTKPVQVIVPYSAGGSSDIITRAVAQQLQKIWGQNVVIDNRAGASGMIGAEIVSKAEPTGYTLLATTSSYPATTAVRAKLPFDADKSLKAIATFARAPMLIAVNSQLPVKSVKELIEHAKKKPLTYGSSGAGGNNHFSGSLFAEAAGITMTHVPYKGIAPAVTALAGGEIDLLISSHAALSPQIDSGRVRLLAVTSAKPSADYPKLPSAAEAGAPGYEYELWWGLLAPAGLPEERANQINSAVNKAIASPEFKKFLAQENAEVWAQQPKDLQGFLSREIQRYQKMAKLADIKPM
jgi:tripartite-type tricarboxylate transporter receptor subunit TctC